MADGSTGASLGLPEINLKKYDKVALGAILGGIGLLTVAVLYGLYLALPYLIDIAQNTIIFFAELAVAVLMVLFGAQMFMSRDAIYYKMKVFARNMRKAVVREDPIGTLDVAIHRFEGKLEEIDTSSAHAEAARQRLDTKIAAAKKQAQMEMALATAAQRQNKPDVIVQQHAVASQRMDQTADTLQPMADNLKKIQDAFVRARDLCAAKLEDFKSQKQALSIQLDAIKESQNEMRSFKRFFSSNTDLDMLELSVEEIERQTTEGEAEIDQFLHVIGPQLETADLKKAAEAEQAMQKLAASIGGSRPQITAGPVSGPVLAVKEGVVLNEKAR